MRYGAIFACVAIALPAGAQIAPGPVSEYIAQRNATTPQISHGQRMREGMSRAAIVAAEAGQLYPGFKEAWRQVVEIADMVDAGKLSAEAAQEISTKILQRYLDAGASAARAQDPPLYVAPASQQPTQGPSSAGLIELGLGIIRAGQQPVQPPVNCITQFAGHAAFTNCR